MEQTFTRKRAQINQKQEYTLPQQLLILLRSHKEIKYMCTNTSIAIRTLSLCDLSMNSNIGLNINNNVIVLKPSCIELYKEFIYKLGQSNLDPSKLLKALNGETNDNIGLKNLRSRFCKELEAKGIFKRKKGVLYNKIELINFEAFENVYNRILEECRINDLSLETKSVLIALDYVNRMESILLQCNETDAASIVKNVELSKKTIKEGRYESKYHLVYEFLKVII